MSTTLDPETGEHATVAEPTVPDTAAAACPSCGAPAEPGQLMCLECGARLALDYQRPPSWRLPAAIVGIVVLLAGAGVAFALAKVSNDAGKTSTGSPTQPVAGAAPSDTPTTGATPAPTGATGAAGAQTAAGATGPAGASGGAPAGAAPTTTATPPPAISGWPPGKSAYTVIVASMPSRTAAEDKLSKARAGGISGAAILHSDDFASLRPGYWVVFDGQFDTSAQASAQAQQDRGKGGFSDAYPRFVSKNKNAQP